MMNMFSRNNRTYLTTAPKAIKYNKNKIAKPDAKGTNVGRSQDKATMEGGVETKENEVVTQRFPNHAKGNANGDSEIVVSTANLMG
jgi:hypothetical protein